MFLRLCRLTAIFPNASVDLGYLGPTFNTNANHNVLFKRASGGGRGEKIFCELIRFVLG